MTTVALDEYLYFFQASWKIVIVDIKGNMYGTQNNNKFTDV